LADNTVDVEVKIGVDKQGFNRELSDTEKVARRGGKQAGESFAAGFSANLKSISAGVLFGGVLFSAIRGIQNAFSAAASDSLAFGRGIAEINSILPQNARLTNLATASIQNFSGQFGTSQQAQAKAFYNIVSAGVQGTANQLSVLASANKTAVAGLVDIDTAAFALVSSVNAYSKSGLTATQASDQLFAAVREGQTTFGELAGAIGRVAPLASSVGITFSELTGTLAAITKGGVSTAEAVTQVRGIIATLIKPTSEARDEAEKLGIDFSTTALRAQGLSKFLEGVIKATNGNQQSLSRLFGSIEAVNGVLGISNQGFDSFNKTLSATQNSVGDTDKAFATLSNTLSFQIDAALENTKSIFTTFFEDLTPALTGFISLFNGLFSVNDKQRIADINTEIARQEEIIASLSQRIQEATPEDELTFFDRIFGSTDTELLTQRIDEAKLKLQELRQERDLLIGQGEGSTGEGDQAAGTEPDETEDKLKERENAFDTFFKNVKGGFKDLAKNSENLGKQAAVGISSGVASGFAAFGAAIAQGNNALDAFTKAFLSSLANAAIQQGQQFILTGIGYQFIPGLSAQGTALIGAGAALSAFGGALGALSGGGGAGGTPGAAGGIGGQDIVTPGSVDDLDRQADEAILEERSTQSSVVINIQGDVLDGDESRLRIAQLLEDSVKFDGAVVRVG
jgi:TP901 family phage tail tape measure protein